MPGGHLRKAEAQAEAEAEKLLGENKTEKKRSFYEFKASLFSLWLTPRHLLRQRKVCLCKSILNAGSPLLFVFLRAIFRLTHEYRSFQRKS
mgnify:CR=1 FL=1